MGINWFLLFMLLFTVIVVKCQHPIANAKYNEEEKKAAAFLERAESELQTTTTKSAFIRWAYESNITDTNEKAKLEFQKVMDSLRLRLGQEAKQYNLDLIRDRDLKRKLKFLITTVGSSALPKDKLDRYNKIMSDMSKTYKIAKVPSYHNKSVLFSLEPELEEVFLTSRDPKELEYYWTEWRAASGAKIRKMYLEYLDLAKDTALLNGHKDMTEMSVIDFETENFVEEMARTWEGIKPLYQQLHAYVRNKLAARYGKDIVDSEGPIPLHLLGNMWAQEWNSLSDILRPYPAKPDIDVTDEMVKQGWTPRKMFNKADEFFQSMGLPPMPQEFWKGSIIEKPKDGRELTCHASAWDFQNGKDYRIKQCTRVNQADLTTVYHEMGHTQYQMSYRNQSFLFRKGANSGFHEGVGDSLSLAVGTANHFQRLGLLGREVDVRDEETNINILFNMALDRLVFLPFGYLVDKYRWDLYSGVADKKDLNCHWVKLRLDIQGVAPPKQRSEEHFDAGAKFHVAANVGYVRYEAT